LSKALWYAASAQTSVVEPGPPSVESRICSKDVSKERHQRAVDFHKKFVAELLAKKAIANTSKK